MNGLPLDLGSKQGTVNSGSVECLGKTFESDDARRKHYSSLLAQNLKDPEFRKTPGFPKGTDEAILRMSDPPYYTACPNPFIEDFVRVHGRPYDPDEEYRREPFAVDVKVGKTDPLYRAHGYHTKVPHLAIVPSVLHYTKPGDIVLDGFCGSGMTGVAAQWCGTAPAEYRRRLETEWQRDGHEPPEWGARRVILGDLSPAATSIAANYNIPFDMEKFAEAAQRILDEVDDELGWMYETLHTDGRTEARINYTVWSELFTCPDCTGEVDFLEDAVDEVTKRVLPQFSCPDCGVFLTKRRLENRYERNFDNVIGKTISVPTRRPILINYSVDKQTFEKPLDDNDRSILRRIERRTLPPELPSIEFPMDDMWEAPRLVRRGITHVHHMFFPRPAHALAALWRKALKIGDTRIRNMVIFFVEQAILGMSVLNRYQPIQHGRLGGSQVNRHLSGTYYVGSTIAEVSPIYNLQRRLHRLRKYAFSRSISKEGIAQISTVDCGFSLLEDATIDYIFTDPPFGDNYPYSELNFSIESWYNLITDPKLEAVMERHKKNSHMVKGVTQYQSLMRNCFSEYFRVIKPGRWITVVFSNSKNYVWRAIQEALGTAGFVVVDVRTLDKKQLTLKQVTGPAVKQDLIISAYKPTEALSNRFMLRTVDKDDVWYFVREHLGNVPVFVRHADGRADIIAERTPQILHDRTVAFFVQRRVAVPISGTEFFAGIDSRFPKRDGMYFLPDQTSSYDRKRTTVGELGQLALFVQDEASATQWVRQQLQARPQSFQDLQPQFMLQTKAWAKHERTIELAEILSLNFLRYNGRGPVPSQIHSYLSSNFKPLRNRKKKDPILQFKATSRWYVPDPKKVGDLEKLRLRTMLKEFEEYRSSTKRKIRQFRTEAVRAGFKHSYDAQDYRTITQVAAKLPDRVIQEDEKLLMYFDVAAMRLGSS